LISENSRNPEKNSGKCYFAGTAPTPDPTPLVYSWNPKSRIASRLRDLVAIIHEGISLRSKESLFSERRLPRRKDKPVIRALEIEDSENVI